MAQGSGIDVREDRLARKNKAKASQAAMAAGPDEIDFDPETMMITPPAGMLPPPSGAPGLAPRLAPSGGSFGEAFAAARAAQGPGGVFEWNGKQYTTDRADDVAGAGPVAGNAPMGNDVSISAAIGGDPR